MGWASGLAGWAAGRASGLGRAMTARASGPGWAGIIHIYIYLIINKYIYIYYGKCIVIHSERAEVIFFYSETHPPLKSKPIDGALNLYIY